MEPTLRAGTLALAALACFGCAARSATPHASPSPNGALTRTELAPSPLASSPHVALGVPTDSDPSDDLLMDKGAYVLSYSDALRQPSWVAWRVTRADLGSAPRSNDFRQDADLPTGFFRVGPGDYARTGYDRGHLCPSAHRTASREENSLTFLMTNMQPQVHALNAGPWKGLESHERQRAAEGKLVYVVAGGIFAASPARFGPQIAVPEASFRITVVLESGQGPADVSAQTPVIGTIMPNDASARGRKWQELRASVDEIERRTRYDFLSALDDEVERAVEARETDASPSP